MVGEPVRWRMPEPMVCGEPVKFTRVTVAVSCDVMMAWSTMPAGIACVKPTYTGCGGLMPIIWTVALTNPVFATVPGVHVALTLIHPLTSWATRRARYWNRATRIA